MVKELFMQWKARFRKSQEDPSSAIARDRLKSALVKDRTDATTEVLDMLAADILKAVACYMEPAGGAALQIKQPNPEEDAMLLARIPIKALRRAPAKG